MIPSNYPIIYPQHYTQNHKQQPMPILPRPPPPNNNQNLLHTTIEALSDKLTKTVKHAMDTISAVNDRWADQLITLNIFKYIDIDSTRRNRISYPNPSNFVVQYTNSSAGNNAFNSLDPVTNAYPYESGTTSALSTTTDIVLANTSSNIQNFYINSILDIAGQYVNITNYNSTTFTATVYPPLFAAPPVGTSYNIRKAIPIITGTLQLGNTENIVILSPACSPINDYYNGTYILFNSGPCSGQIRLITSYNGTTKAATLASALPSIPGLDNFEINGFSNDNSYPMRYSGSTTISQPMCYAVQLLQLTIPNLILNIGYGGKIDNYPYLYVHFYNDNNHSGITMYGNNPGANIATFRVAIDKTVAINPNFFVFSNVNLTAPIAIKFSPTESIRFRVTLPTGEDLKFIQSDNPSPQPPNPLVQISALFGIKRIVPSPKVYTTEIKQ